MNKLKIKKAKLRSELRSRMLFNKFSYLDSAGNLTGAQAACASIYSLGRAVYDCFNSFNVGFPCSV